MSVRAKHLESEELDSYIALLHQSVIGDGNNRLSERKSMQIPLSFYVKSIKGGLVEDPEQPSRPSYIVDLSKEGAGVLTGRRYKKGDTFIGKGDGQGKKFVVILKVVNARCIEGQFKYGCLIEKFSLMKK